MTLHRLVLACLLLVAAPLQAAMVEKPVEYEVGGKKMRSVLVYDDAVATPRPGIVMTPDWLGINANNLALARQIAGADYVLLVADVYGADLRPKNPEEAGAATKALYADRATLRARIKGALAQLKALAGKAPLDGRNWAAIGFCFGGTTSLDLARSGADVAAVVSFHGGLSTDDPALAGNIKGKVLVLHGADDSFVSAEERSGFEKEMRDGGVDWQIYSYGGAVHCFAVPTADGAVPGCRYDARTARRAFAAMRALFGETFVR